MSGRAPVVAAVVLSYNDRESVVRCLESLSRSTLPGLRLVLVDNASHDGTAAEVLRRFPECTVLVNEKNLGFGAGCNVGIEAALAAGADHVMLVNQDAGVEPGTLSVLADFMEAHPRAAIVGPKTWSTAPLPDGRRKLLYAGSWRGRLPLSQQLPGIEQPDDGQWDEAKPADFVWGHGMLLRGTALAHVGLFDPAFFMYYEDLDLCRRARARGWEVWYEPRAVMWHDVHDGARATRSEAWRWSYKVQSAAVFHRKYHGRLAAAGLDLLMVAYEARLLLRTRRYVAVRHLVGAYLRHFLGVSRGPLPARPLAAG